MGRFTHGVNIPTLFDAVKPLCHYAVKTFTFLYINSVLTFEQGREDTLSAMVTDSLRFRV